jgi:transcriptional regulator, XRE family
MTIKIREYRREMGITQTELSKRANVSRATISALENGTLTVTTTETLIKIAKALGKQVSDIFLP